MVLYTMSVTTWAVWAEKDVDILLGNDMSFESPIVCLEPSAGDITPSIPRLQISLPLLGWSTTIVFESIVGVVSVWYTAGEQISIVRQTFSYHDPTIFRMGVGWRNIVFSIKVACQISFRFRFALMVSIANAMCGYGQFTCFIVMMMGKITSALRGVLLSIAVRHTSQIQDS